VARKVSRRMEVDAGCVRSRRGDAGWLMGLVARHGEKVVKEAVEGLDVGPMWTPLAPSQILIDQVLHFGILHT
jgi:hypothetical protein